MRARHAVYKQKFELNRTEPNIILPSEREWAWWVRECEWWAREREWWVRECVWRVREGEWWVRKSIFNDCVGNFANRTMSVFVSGPFTNSVTRDRWTWG